MEPTGGTWRSLHENLIFAIFLHACLDLFRVVANVIIMDLLNGRKTVEKSINKMPKSI